MEIRQIRKEECEEFKQLIESVIKNLPKKEWLIVPTNEQIADAFNTDKVVYWGLFEKGKLLSISSLSFDKEDFLEIVRLLQIENDKVAEIAECMTLLEARGNNYTLKINKELVKIAKEMGVKYLIATAHPDNIASNVSLKKLGMSEKGQFYRYETYLRNYFVMKI